ncbi:MAG: ECF transporter S component [Oscillospiraceae bacterium]|nr:ECF transporter S component [Oscillospiraceae bacterium]
MKKLIITIISAVILLIIAVFSVVLTEGKGFLLATICGTLTCCLPFFFTFENKKTTTSYLVLVAVMTALSVTGRFLFAPVPFFKPVSAMVILTALSLGGQTGFVTGALSAVVSNFYFGQGPWTPFQMLTWGLIGFFAGILSKKLSKNIILLSLYGALSGLFYSLVMDSFTVLFIDGAVNFKRYSALVVTSLPITLCYVVSNVVFLVVLSKPVAKTLNRLVKKYDIL